MGSMSQTTHNYFVEKNRIFKENHESEEQALQIRAAIGTGKSLLSAYPKLMEEWDQERNTGIDPKQLTRTSEIPVNWKCRNGHLWTESVAHRIKYWMVCPECRRKPRQNTAGTYRAVGLEKEFAPSTGDVYAQLQRRDLVALRAWT